MSAFCETVQSNSASAQSGGVRTFWSATESTVAADNAHIEETTANILAAKRGGNARAPKDASKFLDWLNK
jgi:hypothetical protein